MLGYGFRILLWRVCVSRDVCMNELGLCMCFVFVGGDFLVFCMLVFMGGGVVSRLRLLIFFFKMELFLC